jgi:arylsulfatase A
MNNSLKLHQTLNRWTLLVAVALALTSAVPPASSASHPAEGRPPNIIIIMADDLGYGDVSAYNPDHSVSRKDGRSLTPAIDRLARNGVRFTNAHTPSAQCTPTRYSLLTGNHVVRIHRPEYVQVEYNDVWLPADQLTLATMLRENGYRTHFSGKWHIGYNLRDESGELVLGATGDRRNQPDWDRKIEDGPTERGFETSFGHLDALNNPPWKMFENDYFTHPRSVWVETKDYFSEVDVVNGGGGWADADAANQPVFRIETVTRQIQEDAVKRIEEFTREDRPYFLYVCLNSPHVPTTPHPDVVGTTPYLYTDFVAEVDDVVGAITAQLERLGQLENSIVIFTSDNGARYDKAVLEDYNGVGWIDGQPLNGGKCSIYEGGHRVPLVAQWGDPKNGHFIFPARRVSDQLIDLTDFIATIAGLLDIQLSDEQAVDSWNMLPAFMGTGDWRTGRRLMINNSQQGHMAIRHIDDEGVEWKLIFSTGHGSDFGGIGPAGTKAREMLWLGRWNWDAAQLFNLTRDVGETRNLLSSGVITPAAIAKTEELQRLYWTAIRSGRSAPEHVSRSGAVGGSAVE